MCLAVKGKGGLTPGVAGGWLGAGWGFCPGKSGIPHPFPCEHTCWPPTFSALSC